MEPQSLQNRICEIRGVRVMLDCDLAELYQPETNKPRNPIGSAAIMKRHERQ